MQHRTHARTGLTFSELGLGTAPLANLFRAVPDEEARGVMEAAWAGGVRHFDTAPLYGLGLAETRLNPFLKGRAGHVLASKVGRLLRVEPGRADLGQAGDGKWFDVPRRREVLDYGYDGAMRSWEDSLERLGVDRIDVLHAHDLDRRNRGDDLDRNLAEFVAGGHRALHELKAEESIAAIGLGVNEWEPALWLAERAELDVILLAGRWTLLEQGARPLMDLCEARGIGVIVGGPFNSGVLAGGAHFDYGAVPDEVAARVRRLRAVCDAHGVPLAHAALRWPLRHPAVLSVIPGSASLGEMEANLAGIAAEVPEGLWADMEAEGLL